MLILNGVEISMHNKGSVINVFLKGKREDVERQYFSFWNHGATRGELTWETEDLASFWTWGRVITTERYVFKFDAEQALYQAMLNAALAEILNTQDTRGKNPMSQAKRIAKERWEQIEWTTAPRKSESVTIYSLGDKVSAEKDTGNFDDDVLGATIKQTSSHEGKSNIAESPVDNEDEE